MRSLTLALTCALVAAAAHAQAPVGAARGPRQHPGSRR